MKRYLIPGFLLIAMSTSAQLIYPSTVNVSGQAVKSGNYQFELSLGESASINTMINPRIVVTSGVLQSFSAIQPQLNAVVSLLSDEISIYPNPVRDIIEINLLHRTAGKNMLELYDVNGKKLMEKQFDYNGIGKTEKWDLSRFSNGAYFLHIHQMNVATGEILKQGIL